MDFSKMLNGFVKIDKWICPSCYMDFSKLLKVYFSKLFINGFVKIDKWIGPVLPLAMIEC